MTEAASSATCNKGAPLKERTDSDLLAALGEREPEALASALKLRDYARAENLGVSALAHQSGISSTAISQFVNGSYPGDYGEIARRLEKFFWRLGQKEQFGAIRAFVDTAISQALWHLFEKTRIVRRIQLLEGPEQIGKSRAATEYAERNNHGRTLYTKLAGGTRSGCGDFIWGLAETLGIPYTIKLREKRVRIKQALEACDLVLVDEAHLAFTWCDSSQAEFWDYLRTDVFADGERGIVLISTNSDMLDSLQRWRKRTRYNVGQLLGRMAHQVVKIDPAEDITEADVRILVRRYYEPGARALRRLHEIAVADQLGHFGLLGSILTESWTLAKARKVKLDDTIILKTVDDFMATMKGRKALYE